MQGAAFFDEVETVDASDFSIRKKLADHAEGTIVISLLAKGGDEHSAVDDEEIHIRGREHG